MAEDEFPRTASDTIVVAQGTFDILHPGHVHYLEEAAACGDQLIVIVSRRNNVTHKAKPILPARQRRDLIAALEVVDQAILGHESDILIPVEEIDPDVIVLGHDQDHDEAELREALRERGLTPAIKRASPRKPRFEGEILSSSEIIERIIDERA